jgi:hypothetical protein
MYRVLVRGDRGNLAVGHMSAGLSMADTIRVLKLSTGNVSQETAQLLDRVCKHQENDVEAFLRMPGTYPKGEYGWFVYVMEAYENSSGDEGLPWPDGCPEDMKDCINFARLHFCDMIEFDRDNDVETEIPHYNW